MRYTIYILCLLTIGIQASAIDEDNDYYKIYHAAVKAQKGDSAGIKKLVSFSTKIKDPELSASLVKFVVLGMVKSKSKYLLKFIKKVNPDHVTFLQEAPIRINCAKCEGKKTINEQCKQCKNGVCRGCKGIGKITYQGFDEKITKACPSCKGLKKCTICNGTSTAKKDCKTCRKIGTVFDPTAIPIEYKATLATIIELSPKLAFDQGLYIGVGENKILQAATDAAEREKELAALAARKKIEDQQQTARALRDEKAEVERKKEQKEAPPVKVYQVRTQENLQEDLDRAVLEVRNYLKNQERTVKTTLFETVKGKFEAGRPVLYLEVSPSLMNNSEDTVNQYFTGFQKFWELRARNNGLGGKARIEINLKGKKVN